MEKDYRKGQKVVLTLELEDKGQDFIELDVLANGVLLGDSVLFRNGRLTLIGIGAMNGQPYHTATEILHKKIGALVELEGLYVYFKETGSKTPLPWDADTFRYAVTGVKKAKDAQRFVTKK